jgi:hypothetical protein
METNTLRNRRSQLDRFIPTHKEGVVMRAGQMNIIDSKDTQNENLI